MYVCCAEWERPCKPRSLCFVRTPTSDHVVVTILNEEWSLYEVVYTNDICRNLYLTSVSILSDKRPCPAQWPRDWRWPEWRSLLTRDIASKPLDSCECHGKIPTNPAWQGLPSPYRLLSCKRWRPCSPRDPGLMKPWAGRSVSHDWQQGSACVCKANVRWTMILAPCLYFTTFHLKPRAEGASVKHREDTSQLEPVSSDNVTLWALAPHTLSANVTLTVVMYNLRWDTGSVGVTAAVSDFAVWLNWLVKIFLIFLIFLGQFFNR